jgi:hypothetical protein
MSIRVSDSFGSIERRCCFTSEIRDHQQLYPQDGCPGDQRPRSDSPLHTPSVEKG